MRRRVKRRLVAAILVAILLALAAWYASLPRQKYIKVATLREITFAPPPPASSCSPACPAGVSCVGGACAPGAPPVFVFAFSGPVDPAVAGSMASLRGFTPDGGLPPAAAGFAAQVVAALLAKGGVPFSPTLGPSPDAVSTNALPAGLQGGMLLAPLSISGRGEMWFALPPKAPRAGAASAGGAAGGW